MFISLNQYKTPHHSPQILLTSFLIVCAFVICAVMGGWKGIWRCVLTPYSFFPLINLQNQMGDKEVLKYKDIVLRASDLDVLEGPCYLNDQIIGFYFSYLLSLCGRNDVLFVPPSVSFWLANCDVDSRKAAVEPLKFPSKRLVVFTVNDCDDLGGAERGTHWST